MTALANDTSYGRDSSVHPVDEFIPPLRILLLAIQNVAVMYTGAVAVPLIIGNALHLSTEQISVLIQSDLITCGIATIIQTVGFWRFGVRLPMMQGLTFAALSPLIAIGTDPGFTQLGPTGGLQAIYGAVIIAGIVSLLLAPIGAYVVRIFPPVVVGSILITIGLSLIPVAIQYAKGGFVADAGNPRYIMLALAVLSTIILIYVFGKGFVRNIAVFLGLIIGSVIAGFMGMLDLSEVSSSAPIALVSPLHFGPPTFHFVPILMLCMILAITWVESIGTTIILGEIVDRKPTRRTFSDLLRADGLATIIGGFFNSFLYVSITENVALITITGVKSRWVVALAGVLLVLLGLSPFLAMFVASLPKPVVGGVGFVIFSCLVVFGIKVVRKIDFDTTFNNYFTIGISIVMSVIPLVSPDFFKFMPQWSQPIFGSSAILGALTAIGLNLGLNGFSEDNELVLEE